MLVRSAGLCNSRGSTVAIGTFLVVVTVGAVIRSLSFAYRELDPRAITQIVRDVAAKKKKGQRSFKKGGVIVRASGQNSRTVMDAQDFAEHFEQVPAGSAPAEDGFVAYREAGKVWAHELSKDEAATHFPAGKFIGAGTASIVKPGDVLLMPCPAGGALYCLGKSSFERKYASVFALDSAGQALAHHVPSQAETLAHWESKLKANGSIYRKTVPVHAKLANDDGAVETVVDGLCSRHACLISRAITLSSEVGVANMQWQRLTSALATTHQIRGRPAIKHSLKKDSACTSPRVWYGCSSHRMMIFNISSLLVSLWESGAHQF